MASNTLELVIKIKELAKNVIESINRSLKTLNQTS